MLGSIHKFITTYPGLWGIPVYLFFLSAVATAGTTVGGIGLFYSNIFNAAATGFVPGLEIVGREVAMPALEETFNLVSGAFETAPEITAPAPGM